MFLPTDSVVVIAPHRDDEVLGCGGTIAYLNSISIPVYLLIVTGLGVPPHPIFSEDQFATLEGELSLSSTILQYQDITNLNLPTCLLESYDRYVVNALINEHIQRISPTIVFTPWLFDSHPDHSIATYAALISTRTYLPSNHGLRGLFMYETLSETNLTTSFAHQTFTPNSFLDISGFIQVKLRAMSCYSSQLQNSGPRSLKAIEALAVLRGANLGTSHAEAFYSPFTRLA